MNMAANKHKHIRSVLCYDIKSTKLSRQHNNANVMAIGARLTKKNLALKNGARIFTYALNDPHNFCIVEKTKKGKKVRIVEKPKNSKSNLAITGFYEFRLRRLAWSDYYRPDLHGSNVHDRGLRRFRFPRH